MAKSLNARSSSLYRDPTDSTDSLAHTHTHTQTHTHAHATPPPQTRKQNATAMLEMAASKEEFFYEVERLKVKLGSKEQENKALESKVKGLESTVSDLGHTTDTTYTTYTTEPTETTETNQTHRNQPNLTT